MRDPKRIPEIINLLQKHWEKYPDLRFFQMTEDLGERVRNQKKSICDLFYMEDDELLQVLKNIEKIEEG